jgi:hypothetical protein
MKLGGKERWGVAAVLLADLPMAEVVPWDSTVHLEYLPG